MRLSVKATLLATSLLGLSLAGCNSTSQATLGQVLEYQKQTALFVYSEHSTAAETVLPVLKVNGMVIDSINGGSVQVVPLEAGKHSVSLHMKENPFEIKDAPFYAATVELAEGQQLYFRWQEDNPMFVTFARPAITQGDLNYGFVKAEVAMHDFATGRFSEFDVTETMPSIDR